MNFKFLALFLMVFCGVSVMANAQSFDPNFMKCVAQNETSGVDPKTAAAIKNASNYTGIYQMGVNYVGGYLCSNAASIGEMNGVQNWSKCDFQGTLSKSVADGGFGITSYAAFTTGPNAVAAQNYIMQKNSEAMWNQIVKNGLAAKFLNKTINGVVMTKDTMVAMAHLKGYGGMEDTLNGMVNADKNGTTTVGYASCLAQCIAGTGDGKACNMKAGASVFVNACTGDANGGNGGQTSLTDSYAANPYH